MDAVEFVREEIRMCASYNDCTECPLCNTVYCSVSPKKRLQEEAAEIIHRVEEWSSSHPRKTRQSVFVQQYPNVSFDCGIISIKPCQMVQNYTYGDCNLTNSVTDCLQCRKEYWLQGVD